LLQDANGNFFGTTYYGGSGNGSGPWVGTVFELSPEGTEHGTERILFNFVRTNGSRPSGGLIQDRRGILYGTTEDGGLYDIGTVFALAPTGAQKVLYNFTGGKDGGLPCGGLIQDMQGSLYGTTLGGGDYGVGTIFKLTTTGTQIVLHSFGSRGDGTHPFGSLVRDAQGNLYGTTRDGGGPLGIGNVCSS
jgi:uncharacterized repeat protein (TIGR03803 family)